MRCGEHTGSGDPSAESGTHWRAGTCTAPAGRRKREADTDFTEDTGDWADPAVSRLGY